MEEDDRDELLEVTDEEDSQSLSETEDATLSSDNQESLIPTVQIYEQHSKWEFFSVKILLILSSFFMIILLPLYIETINVRSDAYNMLLSTNTFTVIILFFLLILITSFSRRFGNIKMYKLPLHWSRIAQLSVVYTLSGFCIIYAVDRKRVWCHIQDPIKGSVLIFSLLYYFFFCRKFMGLQRIFSATTIIVGLFISVDYGLCDEFKCRGYDRENHTDQWSRETHTIWTAVYIVGLAMFAAYFTMLDRFLLFPSILEAPNGRISSLLSTVSRIVSHPDSHNNINPLISRSSFVNTIQTCKSISALHMTFYIHLFGWIITVLLFWTDFIPSIGKGTGHEDFLNYTIHGLFCHFCPPHFPDQVMQCANLSLYSWLFILTYIVFNLTSIRFLILSQSAVHTVATIVSSLPLVCIWWSLFRMVPLDEGLVQWTPTMSGELICSLLGLPVVILGLYLLCKSHFVDSQVSRLQMNQLMPGPRYT